MNWHYFVWGAALLASAWLARPLVSSFLAARRGAQSKAKLRVVITGSTRGIGAALARTFVDHGDSVVLNGRSKDSVDVAIAKLRDARVNAAQVVTGVAGDVTNYEDMEALARCALSELGGIDIWINNAGITQENKAPLHATDPATVREIITTNLLGRLHGIHAATKAMKVSGGGHIFTLDGAGSSGRSTATFASYGVSLAGLPQLLKTLVAENRALEPENDVGVHLISPGMVLTDLLLAGSKKRSVLKIFNILAEQPDTVASWMVPRMRGVAVTKKGRRRATGTYHKYLTMPGAVWRFLWFGLLRGAFFGVDRHRILHLAEKADAKRD